MNCCRYFLLIIIFLINNAYATDKVINLTVAYKTVNFTGKFRKAISVNNQIPGPTLHFKEGDRVTINVHNKLDKETAIHWHGLLVPWQMDGVKGVTQNGIKPNETFKYQFTLYQSGTYWYHAHAGLQEQQGLYGAFVIDPIKPPKYKYNKDFAMVLSDWSNTNPDTIMTNLKKSGDYYSPDYPLQPSLMKFIDDYRHANMLERKQLVDDYKTMEQTRMSIYDLSDVAYSAFLLNGKPNTQPWLGKVKIGDIVRLRFIGAGASTIFHVKIPGSPMRMVHIDGNDVVPYNVDDFTIAPGETYDVLVKITKDKPYIIYAESNDTVGAAYGALITSSQQVVDYRIVAPFPEPRPVTRDMMSMMMNNTIHGHINEHFKARKSHGLHVMSTGMHQSLTTMNMSEHDMGMATEPAVLGDTLSKPATTSYTTSDGTKYQNVRAAIKTNDPNKPIADVINMELFGYMDRYIWFINGLPEYKAHPIILQPGKRYRFVFTNTSMMHHPMHIHGHWFILRKGKGAYDPLLHTIDVPPGATITADVDTDASGQWFYHCHFLYHMMAGMSRVFQYSTLIEITQGREKPTNSVKKTAYHNRPIVRIDEVRPIDKMLVKHPMAHSAGLWFATFLDIGADPFNNSQQLTYKGLYGYDYNKLELFINDAEMAHGTVENADIDVFYWHLLNQFWAVKGGFNYFYRPAHAPYWQPGISIEGLMPYFVDLDVRGYHYSGSSKLDLELSRDTQITNNFFIRVGLRSILASKTIPQAEIGSGLNQMRYTIRPYYRVMPAINLFIEYEHDHDYGEFKNLQLNEGGSTIQNTVTVGFAAIF